MSDAPFPKKIPEPDSPLRKLFKYPDHTLNLSTETSTQKEPLDMGTAYLDYDELLSEYHETLKILCGDTATIPGGKHVLSKIARKRMDERYKFMWQVRDTCARAEKAEAKLGTAYGTATTSVPAEGFDGPQGAE